AVGSASQSVVSNQAVVTKVYFPRLLIPTGAVGANVVDFAVSFGLVLGMMAWFGAVPGWGALLLPVILLLFLSAALGIGILLAALTVAYRDFRYVVPFMLQLWMFATPAIYLSAEQVVGPRGRLVLPLNPAYGLIVNFRAALLGTPLDVYSLA